MILSFLLLVNTCVGIASSAVIPCYYNTAYEENNYIDDLQYTLNTSQNCYVLLDLDNFESDKQFIEYTKKLKTNNNTIGCYMSVGTVEDWRKDFKSFKKGHDYQSKQWNEWQGEYMIKGSGKNNYPSANTVSLMKKRIDKFTQMGCEYIEMDNMDIDETNKMTNINGKQMRKYNLELCNYIHSKKLMCMAKNSSPSDDDYMVFDGLVTESYPNEIDWWGSKLAFNYIYQNKPFMISHYNEKSVDDCLGIWGIYRQKYNNTVFGFACSQKETKHYIHFGFTINK